jgi:hypothetical protein
LKPDVLWVDLLNSLNLETRTYGRGGWLSPSQWWSLRYLLVWCFFQFFFKLVAETHFGRIKSHENITQIVQSLAWQQGGGGATRIFLKPDIL